VTKKNKLRKGGGGVLWAGWGTLQSRAEKIKRLNAPEHQKKKIKKGGKVVIGRYRWKGLTPDKKKR